MCIYFNNNIWQQSAYICVWHIHFSHTQNSTKAKDKKTSDHSIDLVVGHGRRKVVGKAPRLGKVESNSLHIRGREDTCVTEVKRGRTNNLPGTTTTNYTDTYENGLQYSIVSTSVVSREWATGRCFSKQQQPRSRVCKQNRLYSTYIYDGRVEIIRSSFL